MTLQSSLNAGKMVVRKLGTSVVTSSVIRPPWRAAWGKACRTVLMQVGCSVPDVWRTEQLLRKYSKSIDID